jgi:hypothetical protein
VSRLGCAGRLGPGGDRKIRLAGVRPVAGEDAAVYGTPGVQCICYMAAESCHGLGSSALIVRGYIVPILGIEMSRDSSRVDQIAEQHRKMAALAIGGVSGRCGRRCSAIGRKR